MCIRIRIRYVRSSLAVVVFFIVKSESSTSSGTEFAPEDMKENIRAILIYIAANFRIESNSGKKSSNIRNFEYELNIRPILIVHYPISAN